MKKIIGLFLILNAVVLPVFSWGLVPGEEPPSPPPSTGETDPGGTENPGDNGPSTGGSEEEGPHGPDIGKIQTEINDDIDDIETALITMDVPENVQSLTSEENAETSKIEGEIKTTQDASESTASGNIKSTVTTQKKSNAEKKGDPVNICSGEFVQEDVDFSLMNDFKISRVYRSGNKISGSFGTGISSILDERLILGIVPDYMEIFTGKKELYDYLSSLKKDFEKKFISSYKVTSMQNGISEIEKRISKYEEKLSEIERIENSLDMLSNYYSFPNERSRLNKIGDDISSYISSYQKIINDMKEDINEYNLLDLKIENAKKEYERSYALYIKCRELEKSLTIYNGTPEEWYKTSIEKVVFVDKENVPHLFDKKENLWFPFSDFEKKYILLEKNQEGNFILKKKDGTFKIFSPDGFLIGLSDRNGNETVFERNEKGKVICVKNNFNQVYKIKYTGNFISEICNEKSDDEKMVYSYKENKLSSVTDFEENLVQYEYDESGCLTKIIKPDGSYISYIYGQEDRDGNKIVTSTVNEEGFAEYFSYDLPGNQTVYINHDGSSLLIKYDGSFRTIEEIDPSGFVTKYRYDESGNLVSKISGSYEVLFFYDSEGNLERETYPDGSSRFYIYDSFGKLVSYTDRDGVKVDFFYDGKGNLIRDEKNGYVLHEIEVNEKGKTVRIVEKGNPDVVSEYEYDDRGNVVVYRKGSLVTKYDYDFRNRLVKVYLNGNLKLSINYFGKNIIYSYASGLKTVYSYDSRKDLVKIHEEDEILKKTRTFEYEYDSRHLPLREFVYENNEKILKKERTYSPEGKIISEILYEDDGKDALVRENSYINDELSEVVAYRKSNPLNKYSVTFENNFRSPNLKLVNIKYSGLFPEVYEYDFDGKLKSFTDSAGQVFDYSYTKEGLNTSVPSGFGGLFEFEYNSAGFLSGYGEKNRKKNSFEYFNNGKIKAFLNSNGECIKYSYDNNGNIESYTSTAGTVFYKYDADGNITSLVLGTSEKENDAVLVRNIHWDEKGRTVYFSNGNSVEEILSYDAFGNLIKRTDGEGNERSYEYDSYGRMSLYKDGYGNETKVIYNCLNKISRIDYPEGSFEKFEYDVAGNLIQKKDRKGLLWEGSYDSKGNLISEKNRGKVRRDYTYDGASRITSVLENGKIIQKNKYSDFGKKIEVTDAAGNVSVYENDSFGRLVKEINRLGETQTYLYDDEGNLLGKRDFSGNTSFYNKTSFGTVNEEYFSDGSSKCFKYDIAGNMISAKNDFSSYVYEYDKGGLLVTEEDTVSGEKIQYFYDKAGRKIRMEGAGRNISYTYGKNGELKEVRDITTGLKCSFEYDKEGREIRRKYGNGISQVLSYDSSGLVVSVVQKDNSGRLIFAEGYVYDNEDRCSGSVNHLGQVILYEYNSDGRLSKVLYPYSEEIKLYQKKEMEDFGADTLGVTDSAENIWLTYSQYSDFSSVMETFYPGASGMLTNLQIVTSESYVFDIMGNRSSKETAFGKILYEYDKENNLEKICVNGKDVVKYQHDANGNLLCIDSVNSGTSYYSYNSDNRMVSCEKQAPSENLSSQAYYFYDSLSRRILTTEKKENQLISTRTVYEGFTFDVLKECPVYDNGQFVNVYAGNKIIVSDGEGQSERYRFISDGIKLNKSIYSADLMVGGNNDFLFLGESFPLYSKGKPLAQNQNERNQYFATDFLSTVKNVTDETGRVTDSFSYDVYGTLIGENVPMYGYNGKLLDRNSGFYDFGFRHYSSDLGCFSTKDPVRDGFNWFSYVNGDPINNVDLWGLEILSHYGIYVMNQKPWADDSLGNLNKSTMGYEGCAVTVMSNIVSTVTNHPNTPKDLNYVKDYFSGDDLLFDVVADSAGLTTTSWEKGVSNVDIKTELKEIKNSENGQYVAARVGYNKTGGLHWVGVNDVSTGKDGKTYVEIVPTSVNDLKKENRSLDTWVMGENGKMYVEISEIKKLYLFETKKNN